MKEKKAFFGGDFGKVRCDASFCVFLVVVPVSCPCQIPARGWIRNGYLTPGKVKLHRARPLSLQVQVLNFKVTAALDVSLLLIFSMKNMICQPVGVIEFGNGFMVAHWDTCHWVCQQFPSKHSRKVARRGRTLKANGAKRFRGKKTFRSFGCISRCLRKNVIIISSVDGSLFAQLPSNV